MLETHILRKTADQTMPQSLSVIVTMIFCFISTCAFAQRSQNIFVDDFAKKFVDVQFDKAPKMFRFDAMSKFRWPGKTTEQVDAIFDQAILPKLSVAIAGAKTTARQALQNDFTVAELKSLSTAGQSKERTRVFGRFQYVITAIIQNAEVSVYKANAVAFQKLGLDMNMNEFPFR